jgi:hypothetical protein
MVTGFFADSLNRKLVDVDYYFGMGGATCWHLSQTGFASTNPMFITSSSVKFKSVSNVFNELSRPQWLAETTKMFCEALFTERWLQTGSSHLKEILSEKGYPVARVF